MKICRQCEIEKELDRFAKQVSSKDGLQDWCKDCKNARAREWNSLNKEKIKKSKKNNPHNIERRRNKWLTTKYGITADIYKQMLSEQNNKCAICTKNQSEFKRRFAVDHCHKTSKIRGLLCLKCNSLLGHAEDSQDILRAADVYLAKERP